MTRWLRARKTSTYLGTVLADDAKLMTKDHHIVLTRIELELVCCSSVQKASSGVAAVAVGSGKVAKVAWSELGSNPNLRTAQTKVNTGRRNGKATEENLPCWSVYGLFSPSNDTWGVPAFQQLR